MQRLRGCEVRREHGKGSPRSREPEPSVEGACEQLEVVRDDDEGADGDEDEQPERPRDGDSDADAGRARDRGCRERPEHWWRDARLERSAAQLVQGMRSDAHRKRERERRPAEQRPVHSRRECGAHCDVREVPQRVRRVEERDVVAPATRAECIERGPGPCRRHVRRPQTTIPPPTLKRRAVTSARPASRQASRRLGSGH